jgi:Cu/Ag efflux protein CusF
MNARTEQISNGHVGTGALARPVELCSTSRCTFIQETEMNLAITPAPLLLLAILVACNTASNQPTAQQSATTPAAKRYHLKGKVVSIDNKSKMANIDSEAIPDFMDAMTMPYTVKPESELDKLKPGDAINADVVVQDEKAWLENVAVTGHVPASK